jgi:hypothetical protein
VCPGLECRFVGLRPGNHVIVLIFAEKSDWFIQRGIGRVGDECCGPDEYVWCGEIIQHVWDNAITRGGDGDVENTFCSCVRFLECEVSDVGLENLFKNADVKEVA